MNEIEPAIQAGFSIKKEHAMTFPDLLKSWGKQMSLTRKQQAAALFVPVTTLDGWHDGRKPGNEELLRFVIKCYMNGKLRLPK